MLNLAYFHKVAFDIADYGQENNLQHITNTVTYISVFKHLLLKTHSLTYVTKEKRKNRRRSVSTSASKPVNFEPDAKKIPEYYKNVCLEELKCS